VVRITDRNGQNLGQSTAASFFGELPNQVKGSDPHIVYDPGHQRWVGTYLSFDCSNGYLYLAISSSSDPTAAWDGWYFTFPGVLPDYPDVGISADKVVLSSNEFPIVPVGGSCDAGSPSTGSSLVVVDWAAILLGGSLPDSYFPANTAYWTWRPSRNLSSDAAVHLVSEDGSNGDVISATITGTVAQSNIQRTSVDVTQSLGLSPFGNAMPPPPRQPGSPPTIANAVDERPTDALWQNGSMWFVSSFGCVPAGDSVLRDCVRVTQLSSSGPSVVQDFYIGFAGYDTFMGGIGLSASGNAYFVYSTSSSSQYVSTWMNGQVAGDAPDTVRPTKALVSGAATYYGNRWGDYVGVAVDPSVLDAVWQADEYPNASGTWATRVSMLRLASVPDAPTAVMATPGNASALVGWAAPGSDGGAPISGYTVTSSPGGKTCTTTGALSCTVGSLTNGTPYTFTVAAANMIGSGPASTASAPVTPRTVPGAPSAVTVTPADATVHVAWSAPASNGGSPITAYTVTSAPDGKSCTTAGALSCDVAGLTNGTPYTFTATATNVAGTGPASAPSTAVIPFAGATFHALNPSRVLDTRTGNGLSGVFTASVARTFQVTGRGGVPANATAVTGNLTVTGQTSRGYLFIGPVATNSPTSSTLNFPMGDNRANGVTVALSGTGTLSITSTATTAQVIFDVTGYFM
jgi:hypothetical protein